MSDDPGRVAAVLAATGPVLLDFDGPVCAVYPGDLNRRASDEMRQQLRQGGADVPAQMEGERDPLNVLRYAGTLDQRDVVAALDKTLAAIEVEAVPSAPTRTGRPTSWRPAPTTDGQSRLSAATPQKPSRPT
jgi:hypothetical protein